MMNMTKKYALNDSWVKWVEGIEDCTTVIELTMCEIVKRLNDNPDGARLTLPFRYWHYLLPDEVPVNMSEDKCLRILLTLQILENMRYAAIIGDCTFTNEDIQKYTSSEFVRRFELWQVYEYKIFGEEYPPEYYSALLDEKIVPKSFRYLFNLTKLY